MKKLTIKGGQSLYGTIKVSGSKNASLPIMMSSLLSTKDCNFKNIPKLDDVKSMIILLKNLGVKISNNSSELTLNASNINKFRADYELVRKMRASILVLGPLLARFGKAIVSMPGGCAIGNRPINLHLFAMEKLGAKILIKNGYVYAEARKGLIGNKISLPSISVGATENILLAATLAKGKTIIENAAIEPEVQDLCNCLNKMGAKIKGIGTRNLIINGVKILGEVKHSIIPDRIEAGTFIIASLITKGTLKIINAQPTHLKYPIKVLLKMGAKISILNDVIKVNGKSSVLKPLNIKTSPYPGFPTDLQAQFMSLLATIKGNSSIQENIFENRFMHVGELNRLGASIYVKKDKSFIKGVKKLVGAQVMASDLRASVSLVLAGLVSKGETRISRIYHLDRGYEKIENKLNLCGANIKRIK